MCTVCGCGESDFVAGGVAGGLSHDDGHGHGHGHGNDGHAHDHTHEHDDHAHVDGDAHGSAHGSGDLDFGLGPARAHAPGLSQGQMVRIEQDILGKNAGYAAANRSHFARHGIFAINCLSGPGAGKTTLLVRTIEALRDRVPLAVVEGDQQTSIDADRIRAAGARAVQINTGKGCHLDAHMVGHAMETLRPEERSLLLIENVGNLVCPAAFDLGETHTVVMLSVTEGEDKPLKYPDIFRAADLMLVTKCDLLPHVDFDVGSALENARRINPRLQALCVSARSGEGLGEWVGWIEAGLRIAASTVADAGSLPVPADRGA